MLFFVFYLFSLLFAFLFWFFFFNDTATTEIYTLSLHDALPIAVPQLAVYRGLPDAVRARLANPLSPGMAGPMLAWLATEEKDTYARARWALQPKDWLRLQLTGETAGEPSDASATLLYDLVADTWDKDVIDGLGIDPELLPPLLPRS